MLKLAMQTSLGVWGDIVGCGSGAHPPAACAPWNSTFHDVQSSKPDVRMAVLKSVMKIRLSQAARSVILASDFVPVSVQPQCTQQFVTGRIMFVLKYRFYYGVTGAKSQV